MLMNWDRVVSDLVVLFGLCALLMFFWVRRAHVSEEFRPSWRLLTIGLALLFSGRLLDVLAMLPMARAYAGEGWVQWFKNMLALPGGIVLVLLGAFKWLPQVANLERESKGTYHFYRNLVQEANSIFLRWDTKGRVIFINRYGEEFFGYPLDKLKGRSVIGTIVPETESSGRDLVAMIEDIQNNPEQYKNNENENTTAEGKRVWVSWRNASVISDIDGNQELISIGVDVTERRLAHDALSALAASISYSAGQSDNLEETIKYLAKAYNAKFAFYGVFEDERRLTLRILAFWDGETMRRGIEHRMAGSPCQDVLLGKIGLISQNVSDLYPQDQILMMRRVESYFGTTLKNANHEVVGVIAVMDDKRMQPSPWSRPVLNVFASRIGAELERKYTQESIYELAHYDSLTELPNRQLFTDRLEQLIVHASRSRTYLALLFIDLDRFKNVNDTVGHAGGDLVLRMVAQRLQTCVRANDTLARLGGDEFVVLVADIESESMLLEVSADIAQQVLDELTKPFFVDGCQFFVSASIGITSFPQDGRNMDYLIRNADSAMYQAKEKGGNLFEYYLPSMNERADRRLSVEAGLRLALALDQFELSYQPVLEVEEHRLLYLECLIRWRHPQKGIVPPSDFIEISEESGLIVQIGEWVIREACRQLANWREAGLGIDCLSINISVRQLEREGLVDTLKLWTAHYGVRPSQLVLEITETTLMEGNMLVRPVLKEMRDLGFILSIDDFGTGYSSFGQLRHFPMDILKIDKSFVSSLPDDKSASNIVAAMIAMAKNLGQKVVAEGVETEAQLEFILAQGCTHIQGYLYSSPLSAKEVPLYLSENGFVAAHANQLGIADTEEVRI